MLKEVLTAGAVCVDLKGKNKTEIIRALIDVMAQTGKLSDPEQALHDVLEHEHSMSTGMENGIAIPHAKSAAVTELVAVVGISKKKVDFECLDRKPARIFILTLSPLNDSGNHLKFLSEIGGLLRKPAIRTALLKARTCDDIFSVLISG